MVRLKSILDRTGLQVAYHHFSYPPTLPFIVYSVDSTSNMSADNKVHSKVNNFSIELYTEKKDMVAEQVLEDILDHEEIFYNKYEDYIERENMYRNSYSVSLGGN